jgi:hypothetical protein
MMGRIDSHRAYIIGEVVDDMSRNLAEIILETYLEKFTALLEQERIRVKQF